MAQIDQNNPGFGSGQSRYPGTFLLAFREALSTIGWQPVRWMGDVVACHDADGREQIVGLENLFRRARQVERSEWPTLVVEFLKAARVDEAEEMLPKDLADVADKLLPRLGPPIKMRKGDPQIWYQALAGTELGINLVVDYAQRMCYVTEELLNTSSQPCEHWVERALANLRERTPADCFQIVDDESGLQICGVADAYDSSRGLILDMLLPDSRDLGCLVALPGRDELLVMPVTSKALPQMHMLKMLAEKNHKTAPYPISEQVYWVHKGKWRLISITIDGDAVKVEPPPEFIIVLNALLGSKN
jgi:hypothetical protein